MKSAARDDKHPLGARIGRAVLSNALLVPSQAGLSVVASAVIARSLGAELFGAYAIFTALRASLLFYTDLGASAASSKFYAEVTAREGRRGALRIIWRHAAFNTAATGIWSVALWLAAPFFLRLFGLPAQQAYVFGFAACALVLEEVARLAQTFLWARFAHRAVNLINLTSTAALPLFVGIAVVLTGSLWEVLAASVAVSAVRAVLMTRAIIRELRAISPSGESAGPVRNLTSRFIRVGTLSWLEKLASYLYSPAFLTLALATVVDTTALAHFALAAELTTRVLSLVLSPTHGIILPAFAEVFAAGPEEQSRRVVSSTLRALALLLAPSGCLLIALAPYAIPLIYSDAYNPAVPLVQILAALSFLEYAIYSPANAALLASEHLRPSFLVKLFSIVTLPVYLWLLPFLTLEQATALYGALRLLTAILLLAAAWRALRFGLPLGLYGRLAAIGSAALAAALVLGHRLGDGASAGAVVLIAVLVVLASGVWALGCVNASDRAAIARLKLPGSQWMLKLLHT